MAKQMQQQKMKVDLEELVDMFLEDKVENIFNYQHQVDGSENDPESIFGKVVSDGRGKDQGSIFGETKSDSATKDDVSNVERQSDLSPKQKERGQDIGSDVTIRRLGRSFATAGDEFWSSKRDSASDLIVEITQAGQLREAGKISPKEEEEHWIRFKEMLDKALEDIGPYNPFRMISAILVAVKGLSNFGQGVGILARRFTLRFIEESRLKADIERVGGIEFLHNEDFD